MKPNQYNVLVYPNITHQKDLRQDSWVYVMRNFLIEINKVRTDLFFTILTTSHLKELEFDNTEQRIIKLPSYPNSMRTHFDYFQLTEVLDLNNNDFDIVYSHLPEHTIALKNLIYNSSNCKPIFVGYCHWWEFKESTFYDATFIKQNILGILEMDECGVNTSSQKEKVLDVASEFLNDEMISKLDNILTPHLLGCEVPKLSDKSFKSKYPIIVWNHRVHTYKGWDMFRDVVNELWEIRQDFRVWISFQKDNYSQRSSINQDMLDETICLDRDDYYKKLSQSSFGVACNSKFMGWNVSACDGLSVGLPYLFYDSPNYRELASDGGLYFKSRNELKSHMITLLENPALLKKISLLSKQRGVELLWKNRINPYNEMFSKSIKSLLNNSFDKDNETCIKIVEIIKNQKSIKKRQLFSNKHLNWSHRISFGKYRNTLRKQYFDKIIITKYGYKYNEEN